MSLYFPLPVCVCDVVTKFYFGRVSDATEIDKHRESPGIINKAKNKLRKGRVSFRIICKYCTEFQAN